MFSLFGHWKGLPRAVVVTIPGSVQTRPGRRRAVSRLGAACRSGGARPDGPTAVPAHAPAAHSRESASLQGRRAGPGRELSRKSGAVRFRATRAAGRHDGGAARGGAAWAGRPRRLGSSCSAACGGALPAVVLARPRPNWRPWPSGRWHSPCTWPRERGRCCCYPPALYTGAGTARGSGAGGGREGPGAVRVRPRSGGQRSGATGPGSGGRQRVLPFLCLQIAVRACFLGFAFGCGVLLSAGRSAWRHFGWYMCSLSLFHYSEYLVTAINNPRSLSLDSFLLNHSFEYNLAALSSWVEFTLEKLLFPELKQITWLSTVGLLMVIFGDCLRKAAMLTAGSNFNHIVQNEKSDTHTLVTSGVYGWFRHPSYVGWFYWSIGTQVLLCNPICVVGYALASWRFFRERIEEEEITLIHFFGEEYLEYKRKVPSGLPFIKGVKLEL
ncbi:protein-S-isoprenylcysteine O-methyltransferase [Manacus vitellinus]|nr:protein-S-isoprenylcysteine O-methyltransferase [Manacus vitellinus]